MKPEPEAYSFPIAEVNYAETVLPLAFSIQIQTFPCEGLKQADGKENNKLEWDLQCFPPG